jgi:site-specific recombinase XerD
MKLPARPTTTTISVLTRHSRTCPKRKDRYWRRCNCRKALYIYENGHDQIISARTRSWEQAERFARTLQEERDPAAIEVRRIREREAAKEAVATAKNITVESALTQYVASLKAATTGTRRVHTVFERKVNAWVLQKGIVYLGDVTPALLDEWRGKWSKTAEEKYDQMGDTTQSLFQTRLKGFFEWAARTRLISDDPAAALRHIAKSKKRTQPLTPQQFSELLAAIKPFCATATGQVRGYAKEFKALFLLQRWIGLRISDALLLPRTGVANGRLTLRTQKTGAKVDVRLPTCVIEALGDLSPDRDGFRPKYYFWSSALADSSMAIKWDRFIMQLNGFLHFVDEEHHPMKFHSHMLRDTFAVELLLDGMAIQDVSRLLTHDSIATTERYYGRWVKARRDRLEEQLVESMRRMGATFSL